MASCPALARAQGWRVTPGREPWCQQSQQKGCQCHESQWSLHGELETALSLPGQWWYAWNITGETEAQWAHSPSCCMSQAGRWDTLPSPHGFVESRAHLQPVNSWGQILSQGLGGTPSRWGAWNISMGVGRAAWLHMAWCYSPSQRQDRAWLCCFPDVHCEQWVLYWGQ